MIGRGGPPGWRGAQARPEQRRRAPDSCADDLACTSRAALPRPISARSAPDQRSACLLFRPWERRWRSCQFSGPLRSAVHVRRLSGPSGAGFRRDGAAGSGRHRASVGERVRPSTPRAPRKRAAPEPGARASGQARERAPTSAPHTHPCRPTIPRRAIAIAGYRAGLGLRLAYRLGVVPDGPLA